MNKQQNQKKSLEDRFTALEEKHKHHSFLIGMLLLSILGLLAMLWLGFHAEQEITHVIVEEFAMINEKIHYTSEEEDKNDNCLGDQDYAFYKVVEGKRSTEQDSIKITYDNKCFINGIFKYNEEENTFELLYFRD